MQRTSWPAEAGCKADQAADQARTDNGSQDTESRATTSTTRAVLSPGGRVVVVGVQRLRVMVETAWGERAASC